VSKREIVKISCFSVFKFSLLIGVLLGIIAGFAFLFLGGRIAEQLGFPIDILQVFGGAISFILIIILFGFGIAIINTISALLFNLVSKISGGFEVEVTGETSAVIQQVKPVAPAPSKVKYCYACGYPLVYVEEYQRWYCPNCGEYR